MQIYEALKKDHDKMKMLLKELVALENDSPRRKMLVRKIRDELVPHSRAEESVLYNSLRVAPTSKGKVMHGYREHMEAETLLRTLQVMDASTKGWKPIARQLKKALEHHIKEEETELFQQARQVFSEAEASAMGAAFRRLKDEVRDESFMKTTMEMVANLMPPRLTKNFRSSGMNAR